MCVTHRPVCDPGCPFVQVVSGLKNQETSVWRQRAAVPCLNECKQLFSHFKMYYKHLKTEIFALSKSYSQQLYATVVSMVLVLN